MRSSTPRRGCQRCVGFLFLLALVATLGCGSGSSTQGQKPVHRVKGEVLVDGKPAVGAFVLFVPVKEEAGTTDPRPRATVKEDGSYVLSTYGNEDGAPVGDYLIAVTWPVARQDNADKLGGRYRDKLKSGLKATVKEGANEIPTFKLSR